MLYEVITDPELAGVDSAEQVIDQGGLAHAGLAGNDDEAFGTLQGVAHIGHGLAVGAVGKAKSGIRAQAEGIRAQLVVCRMHGCVLCGAAGLPGYSRWPGPALIIRVAASGACQHPVRGMFGLVDSFLLASLISIKIILMEFMVKKYFPVLIYLMAIPVLLSGGVTRAETDVVV